MNTSKSGVAVAALLLVVGMCFGYNARDVVSAPESTAEPVPAVAATVAAPTPLHEQAEALRAAERQQIAEAGMPQPPKWYTMVLDREGVTEWHSIARSAESNNAVLNATYNPLQGPGFYVYTGGMVPDFGPYGGVNVKLAFTDKKGVVTRTVISGALPDGLTGVVFPSQGAILALTNGILKNDTVTVEMDFRDGVTRRFTFDCKSFEARKLYTYMQAHPVVDRGTYAQTL